MQNPQFVTQHYQFNFNIKNYAPKIENYRLDIYNYMLKIYKYAFNTLKDYVNRFMITRYVFRILTHNS